MFESVSPILDEDGYDTGENEPVYGSPIALSINVSGASGENAIQQFGSTIDYDRVLVTCDLTLPIDEQTVFGLTTPIQANLTIMLSKRLRKVLIRH